MAGNPGSTQRLLTAEQLETLRDLNLPETLILFSEFRGRLLRFTAESAEHARTSEGLLFGIENSFKAYHGEEQALVDPCPDCCRTQEGCGFEGAGGEGCQACRRHRRSLGRYRPAPR